MGYETAVDLVFIFVPIALLIFVGIGALLLVLINWIIGEIEYKAFRKNNNGVDDFGNGE